MIDSWLNAVNDGKMVGVVIVYFKKAFDFVDHQILLTKLKLYSIQNGILLWFNNYLSQRRQQVVMNSSVRFQTSLVVFLKVHSRSTFTHFVDKCKFSFF